jgi:sterol 3beta-glucosyltransferase
MRITILAIGSRGDVEPYVALGLGLQAAGHDVRVATHAGFETLVRGRGLGFALLSGDYRAYHESANGRDALAERRGFFQILYRSTRGAAPLLHQILLDCWRACQDAQGVIVNQLSVVPGYHLAEKLAVPVLRAFNLPVSRTHAYPAPFLPSGLQLGSGLNLLSHDVARRLFWMMVRTPTNQARAEVLSLRPLHKRNPFREMDRQRWLLLYGYSPAVVPRPPDWGDWIHVTGYWFLERPAGWQPPSELVDFLESGPPPVYVGFGSMSNRDPKESTELVVEALGRAGQRGVLVTGWGGLARSAQRGDVYVADEIPFDWLFPRVAAVVHHGGIGTTHLGLRAGAPTVIIPFLPDQRFWGRRVYELGVGPRPVLRPRLTVERLADAIRTVTGDDRMRERAAALGAQIRAESGVANAVGLINSRLGVPAC